jgi:hypothetical protein
MTAMWDHITPAMLGMAATITLPDQVRQQDGDTDQPLLHAFPHGSDIALCGKRKTGEREAATSFCRVCEGMATSVNHRG